MTSSTRSRVPTTPTGPPPSSAVAPRVLQNALGSVPQNVHAGHRLLRRGRRCYRRSALDPAAAPPGFGSRIPASSRSQQHRLHDAALSSRPYRRPARSPRPSDIGPVMLLGAYNRSNARALSLERSWSRCGAAAGGDDPVVNEIPAVPDERSVGQADTAVVRWSKVAVNPRPEDASSIRGAGAVRPVICSGGLSAAPLSYYCSPCHCGCGSTRLVGSTDNPTR